MACTDPTDGTANAPRSCTTCGCSWTTNWTRSAGRPCKRHLDDCSPCLEEAGLDEKLKRLLQTKCGGDKAPEHLRQRVVAELFQVTGRITPAGGVDRYRECHVGDRALGPRPRRSRAARLTCPDRPRSGTNAGTVRHQRGKNGPAPTQKTVRQ